ncbi:MAG: AIR synthase family protein [bacterium]
MSLPQIGKLDPQSFNRLIFPYLGASAPEVILGPESGVDAAVIALTDGPAGNRRVMVVAEDPTFGLPVLLPYFGWSIVHICASDVAVMGIKPQFLSICLLLPPDTHPETLDNIWQQIHKECQKLGIAVVGGHTGVYPGISYPLNGGCTVWGFGMESELKPASAARPGDILVVTKGPAIEATGILALQAESVLVKSLGEKTVAAAKKLIQEMTVVPDALICREFARAMHDATEGGLLGGIYEMAQASGIGVTVYESRIFIPEPIAKVCNYFGVDPLFAISEGTLVVAVPPEKMPGLRSTSEGAGLPIYELGEFTDGERIFIRQNGTQERLLPVKEDPFWRAYFRAVSG